MNMLKVFGAGLSSWGTSIVTNWKKILLAIAIIPVFMLVFGLLVFFGGNALRLLVTWLTSIEGFNEFLAAHPFAIVFGILGSVFLWAILFNLYQTGKEKLNKDEYDKVSSI